MHEDIIKDIRIRCRQAMNGIVSTSMRQWGLDYKVNFGLTIQQIKDLSRRYTPDAQLAETLWGENTRELKILATLLYPANEYKEEIADKWVQEIPNQEIREQISINLFQELPFAKDSAMKWMRDKVIPVRTTGNWLLSRLLLLKRTEFIHPELLSFIWIDVVSEDISLRNASLLTLKNIGKQSKETANIIISKLSEYKESENILLQEIYNSLNFEFEYFFEE